MRLGLDIARHSANRSVDRIILVSGDTDCLPVLTLARIAGLKAIRWGGAAAAELGSAAFRAVRIVQRRFKRFAESVEEAMEFAAQVEASPRPHAANRPRKCLHQREHPQTDSVGF